MASAAASILLLSGAASGQVLSRLSAGPGYRGANTICPERCIVSGPNPSNWTVYHSMEQVSQCTEAMFYAFNVYDEVDNEEKVHRISACTAYGSDWKDEPKAKAMMAEGMAMASALSPVAPPQGMITIHESVSITFEMTN